MQEYINDVELKESLQKIISMFNQTSASLGKLEEELTPGAKLFDKGFLGCPAFGAKSRYALRILRQ